MNHAAYVRDLYELCSSEKTRYTVPLLWDKHARTIVSNESADIVRMFNDAFSDLVPPSLDLYPEALRPAIDDVNDWVYRDISNGVYKCGFAATQEAYDDAVTMLFDALLRAEALLATQRYLVGDVFTEADVRLFTTLVRFDAVYYVHFKASKLRIRDYPNLSSVSRLCSACMWKATDARCCCCCCSTCTTSTSSRRSSAASTWSTSSCTTTRRTRT